MVQSTELAAGSGFTFENFVAARYQAALLTEADAPGTSGIVVAVALQQRHFGEPLDDVIVDFRTAGNTKGRLSLQCKASITISSAASNEDFREVISDCLETLQKAGFREDIDRYGAAVASIAVEKFNSIKSLCESARANETLAHFSERFSGDGSASQEVRQVREAIAVLLRERLGSDYSEETLFRFLRHFVVLRFDALHLGGIDGPRPPRP